MTVTEEGVRMEQNAWGICVDRGWEEGKVAAGGENDRTKTGKKEGEKLEKKLDWR